MASATPLLSSAAEKLHPPYAEPLLRLAAAYREKLKLQQNKAGFLAYCWQRNGYFQAMFTGGPGAAPQTIVPGADLRFQWLRGPAGEKRGVVAAFLLPPDIWVGVSLRHPREKFNEQVGLFKATRLPAETLILRKEEASSALDYRRSAALIGQLESGRPDPLHFVYVRGEVVPKEFTRKAGEVEEKYTREVVEFPGGVEWALQQHRAPSWLDVKSDAISAAGRDEKGPLPLRPIIERMVSHILHRWMRDQGQVPDAKPTTTGGGG